MSPIRSTPRRDRSAGRLRRCVPGAVLLAAAATLTAGCQSNALTREVLLAPVTKQGQVVLTMWEGSWAAEWIVGIVVWGGILWTIVFHRKRSDRLPRQVRYNLPIEILYTVVPFIMVGIMFYFTARDENYIDRLPKNPQVIVNVTGFQWTWEFQYPKSPVAGVAGGVTEVGATWNGLLPGQGSNGQQLPVLEIPVGETVQFNLTSIDVDHAFWVPFFNFKRDLLPGHPNHFAITATRTGTEIGRCSELCGVYHSRMLFRIKIVTKAQFHAWISAQQRLQSAAGSTQ